jgi:hypothetical protein
VSADPEEAAPPPIGGSWGRLYAAVLGNLLVLIVLFWAFSKVFS